MSSQIEALLIEREGYVRRGLKDRVKQVDDALRELGFENKLMTKETSSVEPESERAVTPRASKRKV